MNFGYFFMDYLFLPITISCMVFIAYAKCQIFVTYARSDEELISRKIFADKMFAGFILALVVLLWVMTAHAADSPPTQAKDSYTLYVQTSQKEVHFTRHLTKDECEFALNRALDRPATPEEKKAAEELEQKREAAQDALCASHADKENWYGDVLGRTVHCEKGEFAGSSWLSGPRPIEHAECLHIVEP